MVCKRGFFGAARFFGAGRFFAGAFRGEDFREEARRGGAFRAILVFFVFFAARAFAGAFARLVFFAMG
jgi:hypothetical protein